MPREIPLRERTVVRLLQQRERTSAARAAARREEDNLNQLLDVVMDSYGVPEGVEVSFALEKGVLLLPDAEDLSPVDGVSEAAVEVVEELR